MRATRYAIRLLVLPILGLAVLTGCEPGAPELEVRTFEVRHIDPGAAAEMIEPYVFSDREAAPGRIEFNAMTRTLTVRETPDNLAKIERALAEFDRPDPQVTLHFQIIVANGNGRVDPAIGDVIEELRRLFRFEGYRLATEALIRSRKWSDFSATLADDANPEQAYELRGRVIDARTGPDGGEVMLGIRLTAHGGGGLETTLTLEAGQTGVIGTTRQLRGAAGVILTVRPELERERSSEESPSVGEG